MNEYPTCCPMAALGPIRRKHLRWRGINVWVLAAEWPTMDRFSPAGQVVSFCPYCGKPLPFHADLATVAVTSAA